MTKNLCYITINRVIPLYRIINQINGNIEEINGNKHLIPIPTDESKDTLRDLINSITNYHEK